jgi:hypothetical protein
MQVHIDAVNWESLTQADSIEDFLESATDEDLISCLDIGWSDSAILYFNLGTSIEAVLNALPSEQADLVRTGLLPVISENKQVNELEDNSDVYFISASPQTVAKIHQALSKIDLQILAATIKAEEPEDSAEILEDIDNNFFDYIEQFRRITEVAATKGMGILGSCG